MAHVKVPKDMAEVQTKFMLNLTKRQVVCFGIAAAVAVPVFIVTNRMFDNQMPMIIMVLSAMPGFFLAIYRKDGIPAEKYFLLILRQKFFFPQIRTKPNKEVKVYGCKKKCNPCKHKKGTIPCNPNQRTTPAAN